MSAPVQNDCFIDLADGDVITLVNPPRKLSMSSARTTPLLPW